MPHENVWPGERVVTSYGVYGTLKEVGIVRNETTGQLESEYVVETDDKETIVTKGIHKV